MSRSYQKISAGKRRNLGPAYNDVFAYVDMSIPDWPSVRTKENKAIYDEFKNPEYGDGLFPKYRGLDRSSWFSKPRFHPLVKENIRKRYFIEINKIKTGYVDEKNVNWRKLFIDECNRIKDVSAHNGRKSRLEWLNLKVIRNFIKDWPGDPISIFNYLEEWGYIELAIQREFKLIISK